MLNAEHCVCVLSQGGGGAWVEFTYEIFRRIMKKKKTLQEMKF